MALLEEVVETPCIDRAPHSVSDSGLATQQRRGSVAAHRVVT